MPDAIFVYGTLMQGEPRSKAIQRGRPRRIVEAKTRGRLLDLRLFPALVEAKSASDWVYGEYVEFDDVDSLLPSLDAIEGYSEEDEAGSIYLRRRTEVILLPNSETGEAWVYRWNRGVGFSRVLKSGDWRKRR